MPEPADVDVTLLAGLTPARGAVPAPAGARPASASQIGPGFGSALARALDALAHGQGPAAVDADTPAPEEGVSQSSADAESEAAVAGSTWMPVARAHADSTLTPPAPEPSVTHVERSTDRLAPEFRTRLERVVERMRDELGLQVRVVETFRTQERQDALYAQGRTAPGPTVTWTRNSRHTLGLAADLRVEGEASPKAYAQLARIASEEGLRTLGPSDPGHVEMTAGTPAARTADRASHPPDMVSGLASVARVATVARAARVAEVAHVATPGSRAPAPAASAAAATLEDAHDDGGESSSPDSGTSADPPAAAGAAERGVAAAARPANAAVPAQGADIAARVARLVAMQDAAAQAPTTGMTLLLEGENGADARIRVGVRGATVGATIDVADPAEALRMGNRIGELRGALERQGLEPAIAVRDARHLRDVADRSQHVAPTALTSFAEASTGARSGDAASERPAGQQQRRDPGTADDRPRRNPKEERK